jgi:lysozyme
MFRKEIAKFESGVMRLVTREMTQPQFDALVSFAYNCGLGALEKSSLLRYFNAGDIDRAAKAFALWNKGGGRVLRGLVRRRAAEAALFLSSGVADEPEMPQAVEPSPEKPSRPTVAIGTGVVGAGGAITISEVGQSVQVAKDAKALVPAAASYVWPALILAAGLIGAGLLMRRRNG